MKDEREADKKLRDAIQWRGDNWEEIREFIRERWLDYKVTLIGINPPTDWNVARIGDWICIVGNERNV